MTKRVVFVVSVLFSIILIVVMLIIKFSMPQEAETVHSTENIDIKTLEVTQENVDIDSGISEDDSLIKLESDETYITSFSTDLNEDGLLDEVIAVKKLLTPPIYLILAIQQQKDVYKKVVEIKSPVVVPSSVFFYTIQLQKSLPAIVCEGIGLNKERTLSIYLIKEDGNSQLYIENIASFSSDIQLQLQDHRNTTIGSLEDYSIEAYSFDSNDESNLKQKRTEYTWNANVNAFIKTKEENIQGSKIDASMLQELRQGSLDAYKQYLYGLWYMPKTVGEDIRYIYYDKNTNMLIFHIGDIEEIYHIENMFIRRLGFSIVAVSTSISTIKRRIEIYITNIEELQLKVIEDVASLKINTTSNWTGLYRKKQNTFNSSVKKAPESFDELKAILCEANITWIGEDILLSTTNNSYTIQQDQKEEKGIFNLTIIKDQYVMEMKSNSTRTFYVIEIEHNKRIDPQTKELIDSDELMLKLIPCTFLFSKIEKDEKEAFILKEFRE